MAIQRIRAPKTTRRTPRTFTKIASGGESLYLGLLLYGTEKICYTRLYIHVRFILILKYSQAKDEFLRDAHESNCYDAGEKKKAAVDVDGHKSCSPGYRCSWYQVYADSENKLPIQERGGGLKA